MSPAFMDQWVYFVSMFFPDAHEKNFYFSSGATISGQHERGITIFQFPFQITITTLGMVEVVVQSKYKLIKHKEKLSDAIDVIKNQYRKLC